jgi:D-sedoheptulose 7-phosphate isomerase
VNEAVLGESVQALLDVDDAQIDRTVEALRHAERVFCFGNGGGYAHAMHFASDLRKIAGIQAFSFDNVAELTARVNDDGWERAWDDWRMSFGPGLDFLFSCGGGNDGLTRNFPWAYYGIVGANGGGGERIVIPSTSTPVIEGCQSVIAHHIVEQLAS